MGSNPVRRNLFPPNINRRPTPTAPPNPTVHSVGGGSSNFVAGAGIASNVGGGAGSGGATGNPSAPNPPAQSLHRPQPPPPSFPAHRLMRTASSSSDGVPSKVNTPGALDSGEIVPRDTAGGYKAVIPMLPTLLPDDGGNEMEGIEQAGAADDIVDLGMSGREREKIEASLVELMCMNRNRQMSTEPAEIANLITQSLRSQVATLDEDNWMYEGEEDQHV